MKINTYLFAFLSLALLSFKTKEDARTVPEGFVYFPETYIESKTGPVRIGAFEIMDHVITNREYKAFINATSHPAPEHWKNGKIPAGFEDYPVIYVNRFDIYDYTNWLSKVENRVYTLPTAEQFEIAARNGTKGHYYWGNEESMLTPDNVNFDVEINRPYTEWQKYLKPAKWGMKNAAGLYGMCGNVWQFTLSFPDPAIRTYTFRLVEKTELDQVIMVGGSWARSKEYLKCGLALYRPSGVKSTDAGFRLVREPENIHWKTIPRRITAVTTKEGNVAVSWAILNTDTKNSGFNIYRLKSKNWNTDGTKLNEFPIKDATSYIDTKNLIAGQRYNYRVVPVDAQGKEGNPSEWTGITVDSQKYAEVVTFKPVYQKPGFTPVFGDLEGNGKMGCVIRLENGCTEMSQDPGYPVQLEAFTSYGRSLWRKDIASHSAVYGNAHNAPFNVWDLDGDGRAEVITFMEIDGENYLAILDGTTGKLLRKAPWTKMSTDFIRSSTRHLISIGYLDGKNPSIITQTGLYENERITAYDAQLNHLWTYDSFGATNGSGGHKIELADVDGDGKQEVFYGTNCLNHDGTLRWSIYRGHADIISVQDYIPDRPGLEVYYLVETKIHAGAYLVDANTGEVIWKSNKDDDSRWDHAHYGWTADIWDGSPGKECTGVRNGHDDPWFVVYSAKGKVLQDSLTSNIRPFEWDGDLTRELFYNNGYNVGKWNGKEIVEIKGSHPNPIPNSTCIFTADLCGDFRSELVVLRKTEEGRDAISIVTSTEPMHKKYISPAETIDYKLWLSRNCGGGYASIFDAPFIEPK